MASKVFGYQRFPSKIFELDTDQTSKNETSKQLEKMFEENPTLAKDENFMVRNNTYAVIPPVTVIYNTRAQTSLFRNIFLLFQENNTNEVYLQCSFDHFKCQLTRLEHFLHDVYLIFNPIPKQKKKKGYEISWLNENFVQRFYNKSMRFIEFADHLTEMYDFKSKTDPDVVNLCWKTYYREVFFRLSANTLVTQLEDEDLQKLFEIFTHLDHNVICKVTPFLVNQFLTWWISESGFKLVKEVQNLTEWYETVSKESLLDFPEFTKQIYRLFLSGVPQHIYKSLITDAWDCIVFGVIKKGHLEKVGPKKGRWLPRIMYLYVDKIEYFKRKYDGNLERKGFIQLGPKSSVTEVFAEDKLGFFQLAVVCSDNRRKYLLRADDQRIRHIWVTSIQNVLDVMKGATKPLVLEKPLKFVQDIGSGDHGLTKVRSYSTNEGSKVNTLNGKQLIFNKRHSDDFTKHFQIEYSKKLPRSSSFTRVSPGPDLSSPLSRVSVVSKASTMSDCMDLTISPHPGQNTFAFFPKAESREFEASIPEQSDVVSNGRDSDSSCEDEYASMSNQSPSSAPYVITNISKSLRHTSDIPPLNVAELHGMTKSQSINEYINTVGTLSPKPVPEPRVQTPTLDRPIPAPRRKAITPLPCYQSEPELLEDPDLPKIPQRRIPKAPERSTSKMKRGQYENTYLLNQL